MVSPQLRVLLVVALAIGLAAHVPLSAALVGTATCPVLTQTEAMSAWCTARFGGNGGTLTAGPWDSGLQSFQCICNANPAATLTVSRSTTPQQPAGSQSHRDDPSASAALAGSSSHSTSLSPSHSKQDDSSLESSTSSSSLNITVNGTCAWNGVFTRYPDGVQCMATTGLCPMSCSVIPSNLCNNPYIVSETCTSPSAYVVSYTCMSCNGRNYTISSTSVENCTRYYTGVDTCDAQSSCSGRGCCVGPSTGSGTSTTTCTCFNDGTNGYYTGTSCNSCQSGYDRNSAGMCLVATNKVQFILASIAKTWTMVAPNMAVLFLFVIFSVTRKLNASDRPFDLTGLRRANLSTVQVARRQQQSLFHSKYIPMRPAKSRSFANPHQPQTRGPPAF